MQSKNSIFRTLAAAAVVLASAMSASAAPAVDPQPVKPDAADVVKIDHEPNHHLVLSTDAIRVFDVSFPSGAQSKWHSHFNDSLMITLDGADVPSQTPGQPVVKRPPIASGYIYYKPYGTENFVHRISNVDDKTFRILDIELLAPKQGVQLTQPDAAFKTVLENDRVRVTKTTFQVGGTLEAVSFKGPRLYVALNDGTFAVGDYQVNVKRGTALPAIGERTERLRNLGKDTLELAVVEMK